MADASGPLPQRSHASHVAGLARDNLRAGATTLSSALGSMTLRLAPAPAPVDGGYASQALNSPLNASQTDKESLESALDEYLQAWGVPRPGPQAPAAGPAVPSPSEPDLLVQVGLLHGRGAPRRYFWGRGGRAWLTPPTIAAPSFYSNC